MTAIFYDLETSSQEPLGQIINVACICIDAEWNEYKRFYAEFKISPLELPAAGAILANRTNVMHHQEQASYREREGLYALYEFIEECIREASDTVSLIGYNSQRFDLPYLRTSFIRNGINPYFGGRLQYADLLHVVRYCSATDPQFPRVSGGQTSHNRLSLRLETVATELGLLEGAQSHHSLDDVLLTIETAKTIAERFAVDVRTFTPYMLSSDQELRGAIVSRIEPEYDLSADEIMRQSPYLFIDADHRSALWLDCSRYSSDEPQRAIRYFHRAQSPFFRVSISAPDSAQYDLDAEAIYASLGALSLKNFFSPSSCDIEQDIYRLDFDGIKALHQAIWQGNFDALKGEGMSLAKSLYIRHWLKEQDWTTADQKARQRLQQYATSRYSGTLSISKTNQDDCHPGLDQLLEDLYEQHHRSTCEEDRELLESLLVFYQQSPVVRLGLQRSPDELSFSEYKKVEHQ